MVLHLEETNISNKVTHTWEQLMDSSNYLSNNLIQKMSSSILTKSRMGWSIKFTSILKITHNGKRKKQP